jgi:UrcA family protein
MKLAIVAAALTIAAVPAAVAQPYDTINSVRVYTGDLNLADPRDRDEAAYRISLATNAACQPSPDIRVLQEFRDYQDCRAEAFDDAMDELAHRARHHRRGHVTTHEYPVPPEPRD